MEVFLSGIIVLVDLPLGGGCWRPFAVTTHHGSATTLTLPAHRSFVTASLVTSYGAMARDLPK